MPGDKIPTFDELRDLPGKATDVCSRFDYLPQTYYRLRKANLYPSSHNDHAITYTAYEPSLLQPLHPILENIPVDTRFLNFPWNYTPTGEFKEEAHITAADLERHAVLWKRAEEGELNDKGTQTDAVPVLHVATQTSPPSISTKETNTDLMATSNTSTQIIPWAVASSLGDASAQIFPGLPGSDIPNSISQPPMPTLTPERPLKRLKRTLDLAELSRAYGLKVMDLR